MKRTRKRAAAKNRPVKKRAPGRKPARRKAARKRPVAAKNAFPVGRLVAVKAVRIVTKGRRQVLEILK
jgi:hypothetical protein